MFNSFKDLFSSSGSSGTTRFRKPRKSYRAKNVEDAEFYEINESKKNEDEVTEEVIDQILEKISRSGYQNLTEREKRILFEASKKG
jgi:predicted DNA binding protein